MLSTRPIFPKSFASPMLSSHSIVSHGHPINCLLLFFLFHVVLENGDVLPIINLEILTYLNV